MKYRIEIKKEHSWYLHILWVRKWFIFWRVLDDLVANEINETLIEYWMKYYDATWTK